MIVTFKRNKNSKTGPAQLVLTALILVIVGILLFSGKISAEIGDEGVSINSFLFQKTILYDDITDLELREQLDKGTRTFGVGAFKISSGSFKNAEFEPYKLCVYNAVNAYIVIRSGDKITVFNLKTIEETQAAHTAISAKIGLLMAGIH